MRKKKRGSFVKLYSGNLIGNKIKVLDCRDPTLISRSGIVIDETKNMIRLAEKERDKTILVGKAISFLEIELRGKRISLSGREILGTPQERIHKI
jgi:RNase P/RNase MRP subunit p29